MATQTVMRQRVYDNLYGAFPTDSPFVTRLAAAYAINAGSITVLDDTQWAVGDTVENLETGELFKVVALPGADVLTVISAWAGSTPSASVGTDDVLYKNPRFSRTQVDNAIASTIASLPGWGIHVFGSGEITRADPKEFYELTTLTDILAEYGILKAYSVKASSEFPVPIYFRFSHSLGVGSAEYTAGYGIYIGDWGLVKNAEKVFLVYAKEIGDTTDLLVRQEELVVQGAVALLLGATIVKTTHDPGARTDRTVQPGQTSRDVRNFQGKFYTDARVEAGLLAVERQNLLSETPRYARSRRWRG